MSETNWQKARDEEAEGYVYVLSRESYVKGNGWVWRGSERAVPVAVLQVGLADLTDAITIMSDADKAEYVLQNS